MTLAQVVGPRTSVFEDLGSNICSELGLFFHDYLHLLSFIGSLKKLYLNLNLFVKKIFN